VPSYGPDRHQGNTCPWRSPDGPTRPYQPRAASVSTGWRRPRPAASGFRPGIHTCATKVRMLHLPTTRPGRCSVGK